MTVNDNNDDKNKRDQSVLILEIDGMSHFLWSCADAADVWEKANLEVCPFCGAGPDNDGVVIHKRFDGLH